MREHQVGLHAGHIVSTSFAYLVHLTEQRIAKTDRHRLGVQIVIQRRLTKLASDTALLEATEWQLPVERVVCVDPDSSGLERVRHLDGCVEVRCVDCGSETVVGVVTDRDGILLGLELGDGAHGAEDLFLYNLHVLGDVGEDGGFDEEALVADTLAAGLDGCAGLLALLNVTIERQHCKSHIDGKGVLPHNPVELDLRDLRTLEGFWVEGVANSVLRSPRLELLHELVVDTLLDVDARTSAATLSVVEVDTEVDP
jgi:hypothetical protein